MSERPLAHIERVVEIQPIPGADKIEVATVLGWQCVVKKDEVKTGDLVCYIEIDSVVPAIPYFDFMTERNYRVRTIKLRKQISQGLVIPISKITEIRIERGCIITPFLPEYKEGDDVTSTIGIIKYESQSDKESNFVPLPKRKYPWYIKWLTRYQWFRKLTGMRSGSFPDWISKTDESRIQNMPWVLTKYTGDSFYVTEKIDGQSATYWYKHHWLTPEFGICSRTVRKSELDGSNWSKVAKQFDIKNILKSDNRNICIQGEIIGPKIQGNKYKLSDFDFYVFNVFDIDKKRYFSRCEIVEFCNCVGLKYVPILNYNYKLPTTVQDMLEYAKGKSVLYNTEREGIVVRSYDQNISFKVINNDFLLKNGD